MTELFTGHALAERLNSETRSMLHALARSVCLVLLHDPDNAAAMAYVARIEGYAKSLGIDLRQVPFGTVADIEALAKDLEVDAVLPLLPLPETLDPVDVVNAIGSARDADGQHAVNMGNTVLGVAGIAPPTAQAAFLCLAELAADLQGRKIAVVGASTRVGRPLALLLLQAGATVSIANEHTTDLPALTRAADIIVSATGVAGLITADYIAEGAILLDVGIIQTPAGLVGDIDRASVVGRASVLSLVPDGVGPVTAACLMRNVALLAAGYENRKYGDFD